MKRLFIAVSILLASGCSPHGSVSEQQARLACECFVEAAYEAYREETLAAVPKPQPEPQKCCGECGKNGLPKGKVLSGDRQKVVPCPCPDTCECKSSSCVNGACKK